MNLQDGGGGSEGQRVLKLNANCGKQGARGTMMNEGFRPTSRRGVGFTLAGKYESPKGS